MLLWLQGAAWGQAMDAAWVVGGTNGEPWAQARERWIALDDTRRAGSIQPQEIPRGHSVMRELVRTTGISSQRNVFGYTWNFSKGPITLEGDTLRLGWNPRLWDGGGREAGTVAISRGLVDGDGLSPAFLHAERIDGLPTVDKFFTSISACRCRLTASPFTHRRAVCSKTAGGNGRCFRSPMRLAAPIRR